MAEPVQRLLMNPQEESVLRQAVDILEGQSFIARLTDLTGEPVSLLLKKLPGPVTRKINSVVRSALAEALDVALYKMEKPSLLEPSPVMFQVASGITGGIGGFFGMGALALELPVTTTLMLRSIAGIAVRHGERMTEPSSRLACLEVFALGPQGKHGVAGETSYYAARAFLAKTVSEAAQSLVERTAAKGSAPIIVDFVTSVASRFGIVVSDKVAATAVPVVGAIGGAAINLAFMHHYQSVAKAHFAVRRLERAYGSVYVRNRYHEYEGLRKTRTATKL